MSTTEKVNEELPDGEALAGFAANALGGGARRRRRQQADSAAAPAETPAAEEAKSSSVKVAADPEPPIAEEPPTSSAPSTALEEQLDSLAAAADHFLDRIEDPRARASGPLLAQLREEVESAGLLGYEVPGRDGMSLAGILNEHMAALITQAKSKPVVVESTSADESAGAGDASVPRQSAAPETTAEAASEAAERKSEPGTALADTKPEPGTATAAVEVRAVPVTVARTSPVPPGLQGGVVQVQVPDLGPTGTRGIQCTVMISQNVRDRFNHYQLSKKWAGESEPSNAMVVRRAFLNARRKNLFGEILAKVYHQANAVDEEDYDEDGLLGEVVGRRAVRGRLRDSGQQSFRPSEQELATYDAFSTAYGFPDRSAFMEGLLDHFLPQLPTTGRRR